MRQLLSFKLRLDRSDRIHTVVPRRPDELGHYEPKVPQSSQVAFANSVSSTERLASFDGPLRVDRDTERPRRTSNPDS